MIETIGPLALALLGIGLVVGATILGTIAALFSGADRDGRGLVWICAGVAGAGLGLALAALLA